MDSTKKGSAVAGRKSAKKGSSGGAAADTYCDICWQRPSQLGMNFRVCQTCGVGVHDQCYGIVRDDDDDSSSFTCWACQAVGTTVKVRRGKSITIETRPTACCLCSVDDGMDWPHAMHPVFDKDRVDGRQAIVPGTKDTLAWAHSLCGFFLNSSPPTSGCVYGCFANGDYVGLGDKGDYDDDISVNSVLAKGDPNDETIHHLVFCQGNNPDVRPWTKAIAATQRDLRCFLCGKDDRGTMRICTQCYANDPNELKEFRPAHSASLRCGQSCFQGVHVGCAMWYRQKRRVYPYRRVFYFPGIVGGEKTSKRGTKTTDLVCNAFCNIHVQDLVQKKSPGVLRIHHPPHIQVQSPPQLVTVVRGDLGEAKSAYQSRKTLDPRERLLDPKQRSKHRSAFESQARLLGASRRSVLETTAKRASPAKAPSRRTASESQLTMAAAAKTAPALTKMPPPAAAANRRSVSESHVTMRAAATKVAAATKKRKVDDRRSASETNEAMGPAAATASKKTKIAARRAVSESGLTMKTTAAAASKTIQKTKDRRPSHDLGGERSPPRKQSKEVGGKSVARSETGGSARKLAASLRDPRKDLPAEAPRHKKRWLKPTHLDPQLQSHRSLGQVDRPVNEDTLLRSDCGESVASPPIPRKSKAKKSLPVIDDQSLPAKHKQTRPAVVDAAQQRSVPPPNTQPEVMPLDHEEVAEAEGDMASFPADDSVPAAPANKQTASRPPPLPDESGGLADPQEIIDEIIEAEKTYHLDQCLKRKKAKWGGAKNFATVWPQVVETICKKFNYDARRKTDWKQYAATGPHEPEIEVLWEGEPPSGTILENGCLLDWIEQEEKRANADRLAV